MQRHATLLPLRDEALRDDPKNGCEGDEGGGRLRDSNHRGSLPRTAPDTFTFR